jgi:glycosyltransferase involved in cell wall biosynthesis
MQISIIIPALDEEKRIGKVVKQFSKVKGDFEVIVADGGSNDKTVEIAKKEGAKVYSNIRENQNIAKNRNLGAKKAKGEILIFCDADTKL